MTNRTVENQEQGSSANTNRIWFIPATYTGRAYGRRAYIFPILILGAVLSELLGGVSYLTLFAVLATLWTVYVLVIWARAGIKKRADQERPGNPLLKCYGSAEDLARLDTISDEFFEPHIAQTTWLFDVPYRRLMIVVWMVVHLVPLIVMMTLEYPVVIVVAFVLLISFFFRLFIRLGFPQYCRVVPGRVDILRYRPFSNKTKSRKSVSLEKATIECRFHKYLLEITPAGEEEPSVKVYLNTLRDAKGFAEMVFQGAQCKRPSPILPDDELMG